MSTVSSEQREITVGIAGAAGDGLDKTGTTLANTASRLGVHIYGYNSYQSLIRGGTPGSASALANRRLPTTGTRWAS